MTFDKRLNNSMSDINLWTTNQPSGNIPGADLEARNAIVALQAQVEAMQRGMAVLHGHIIAEAGLNMKGSQLDVMLTEATDIRAPEFPRAVLATAGMLDDEEDEHEDVTPPTVCRKTKPKKPASVAAHQEEQMASGRRIRGPRKPQPKTLSTWLAKLEEACGVKLSRGQILYRHLRFEQPQVILLPESDAAHQKLINWSHSKILDYAVQYGTEDGTGQHWLAVPTAALDDLGLAIPDPSGLAAG